jgi:hypothetical protein
MSGEKGRVGQGSGRGGKAAPLRGKGGKRGGKGKGRYVINIRCLLPTSMSPTNSQLIFPLHFIGKLTVLICPPQSPAGLTGIPRNPEESPGILRNPQDSCRTTL